MLVLSRRIGEKILIDIPGLDKPVEIKVARISGGRVSLGIVAPREIEVVRAEKRREPSLTDGPEDA